MSQANLYALSLPDLKLGLTDLLERRQKPLQLSIVGRTYQPALADKAKQLAQLKGPAGGPANVEKLAQADAEHDAYGRAIHALCQAYLHAPGVPQPIVDAVTQIRAAFVPELGELNAKHSVEAQRAKDRKAKLESMRKTLESIPVAGNQTLFHWVQSYLDKGLELDALLSGRADARVADESNASAINLRGQTLGMLTRMRESIADEIDADPKLPRDLDGQIFGYLDELATRAVQSIRKPKKDLPAPKPG